MLFTLEVLQAYHGDCLILHYGEPTAPRFLVVDGGPAQVYEKYLGPRLDVLKRRWRPDKKLSIDLLLVTHVDDDHIQGVIDLMRDLVRKKEKKIPAPYQILTLWHNSFEEQVGKPDLGPDSVRRVSTDPGVSASGLLLNQVRSAGLDAVAATIEQGRELYNLANALNLDPLNHPFKGAVMTGKVDGNLVALGKGLALRVLHPDQARLDKLQKEWQKAINKPKKTRAADVSAAATKKDTSPINLSSIVVMAECEGKRMLLTGDAMGDDILQGLKQAGLIKEGTCKVDLLKLPHHGSSRNVTKDFFRTVVAKHYVISANGKYGNPDMDTLNMLVEARPDDDFTLHLTNQTGEDGLTAKIEKFRKKKEKSGRGYELPPPLREGESIKINLLEQKVTY